MTNLLHLHDNTDESRRAQRVNVDLLLNKYIKGRPYLCRASNLSRNGLRIHKVFEPDSKEQMIGLQFQLPGYNRVITCAGRIIHSDDDKSTFGVKLTNVDSDQQALLDDFIGQQISWDTQEAQNPA